MSRERFRRREAGGREGAAGDGRRMEEVRRLELRARRLVDSRALGAYESVFRGHGVEFAEVRAYQSGDPFQAIDWKVTARMGRPFVKRFVEERELVVLLALDLSASTGFGTRRRLKRELAVEVAGVLGLAALRSQDRVGLLLFTDRVERYVPPRRGRHRLLRLLHEMVVFRPEGRGTDLPAALTTAVRLLSARALVFVLSDFPLGTPTAASPPEERLERALRGLSRRHDVVAVEVRDPAEAVLPDVGLLEVEDPETGRRGVVDLGDQNVRKRLLAEADAEEERLAGVLRRARVDRISLRTDRPYATELAAFFAARGRQRRRS